MKQRVISALIIAVIGVSAVVIGGIVLDVLLLAIATIGLYEFYGAFAKKGHSPIKIFGLVYIAFFALMLFLDGESYMTVLVDTKAHGTINLFPPIFIISLMALLAVIVFQFEKYNIVDIAITLFGGFYVVLLLSYFVRLRDLSGGIYLFFIALVGAVATDTFAFFVGKKFGKRKLLPSVSPKKTVAGSVGGFLGNIILITIIGAVLIYSDTYTGMALYHYIILGALIGIVAQVGDLVASAIKRYAGVKDFGKIIPGHGGILDRIDSYIFTVPVVYYYLLLFGIGGVLK